jgi:IS30 family transposase
MRDHKWSLDACCGHAKRHQLFRTSEMVCTRTLYNMVWANLLPVKVTELPEALKHSSRKHKNQENKKCYGASISKRPEIASLCTKKGH